jgi:pSer/pThr/pTyr-binding forkhead associated (FHA) protein
MPTIILTRGDKTIGTYAITKKSITIGRSRENTIAIANKAISRKHATIDLIDEGYVLTDHGSLNGTFVNDQRVQRSVLANDDRITVGSYTIVFRIDADSPAKQDRGAADESQNVVNIEETGSTPAVADAPPDSDQPKPATPVPQIKAAPAAGIAAIDKNPAAGPVNAITSTKANDAPVSRRPRTDSPRTPATVEGTPHDLPDARDTASIIPEKAQWVLEEKIRSIIIEKAFASESDIRKNLATEEYGKIKINRGKLRAVLKQIDLDTSTKRYQFFIKS